MVLPGRFKWWITPTVSTSEVYLCLEKIGKGMVLSTLKFLLPPREPAYQQLLEVWSSLLHGQDHVFPMQYPCFPNSLYTQLEDCGHWVEEKSSTSKVFTIVFFSELWAKRPVNTHQCSQLQETRWSTANREKKVTSQEVPEKMKFMLCLRESQKLHSCKMLSTSPRNPKTGVHPQSMQVHLLRLLGVPRLWQIITILKTHHGAISR